MREGDCGAMPEKKDYQEILEKERILENVMHTTYSISNKNSATHALEQKVFVSSQCSSHYIIMGI